MLHIPEHSSKTQRGEGICKREEKSHISLWKAKLLMRENK